MRIRRLDLTRFGRFTDHVLDFGSAGDGKPDFHLIVGTNEAGKSTLTAAIVDLFFGIGQRSPYGFLHGYDTMQIAAALDLPGGTREVVRVKRGARLRDANGQAMDEGMLTAAMSGISRDAYRTMFCLDEETLRLGGEGILASQGELGQLLFSASAGLAAFGTTLVGLQEAADAFHKPRGRSTTLSALRAKLDELKARKDGINVLATTYAQLVGERDDAAARYDEAIVERGKSKVRLDEIARFLAALPDLAIMRSLQRELSSLPDVPQPPASWAERLPELIGADARLRAATEIASANVERLRRERDELEVERAWLDAGPSIDALHSAEARYLAALDIPKREAELAAVTGNLTKVAQRLDRAEADPAALVLPAPLVGKLRGLIDRRSGIQERVQASAKEQARAAEALTAAKQDLEGLVPADDDETSAGRLQSILEQARASDHGVREKAARRTLTELETALQDQLLRLGPWAGSLEGLMALRIPGPDLIQEWRSSAETIRQALVRHETDVEALTTASVELSARIQSIKAATGLVEDEAARTSRERRDEAWSAHLRLMDHETAEAFESLLRKDDVITDSRLAQTEQAADLRQASSSLATTSAKLGRTEALYANALEARLRLEREVSAALLAIGLPPDTRLAELERWLSRRAAALEMDAGVKSAQHDLLAIGNEAAAGLRRLASALGHRGLVPAEATFDDLLAQLQATVDHGKNRRTEIINARRTVAALAAESHAREREFVEAKSVDDNWQLSWDTAMGGCWLGAVRPPCGPDEVNQVLSLLAEIPAMDVERDSLRHRVATMRRDQDLFRDAVRSIAQQLSHREGADPLELAAELRQRLERVRRNAEARRNKEADIALAEVTSREAREALRLHEAEMAAFTSFFGAPSLREVGAKIEQAARRAELKRQIKQLGERILSACRCDEFEAAEAMLGSLDRSQLETEAATLGEKLEAQDQDAHDLHARRMQADRSLATIGGDDAVARIDENRRTVLAEIEEQAVRFMRLKLGIAAAHQALQIFRETHRTSMLQAASDAFRTITKGAYSGLATQPSGDKEILIGVIATGGSKVATEMSTGTRAQLYLALRIAGYHEFGKTRPSLPFIADDILETFDDLRSEEACRLLTDMSRTGQVIVATHHHHLIDIARGMCPAVIVHELPA